MWLNWMIICEIVTVIVGFERSADPSRAHAHYYPYSSYPSRNPGHTQYYHSSQYPKRIQGTNTYYYSNGRGTDRQKTQPYVVNRYQYPYHQHQPDRFDSTNHNHLNSANGIDLVKWMNEELQDPNKNPTHYSIKVRFDDQDIPEEPSGDLISEPTEEDPQESAAGTGDNEEVIPVEQDDVTPTTETETTTVTISTEAPTPPQPPVPDISVPVIQPDVSNSEDDAAEEQLEKSEDIIPENRIKDKSRSKPKKDEDDTEKSSDKDCIHSLTYVEGEQQCKKKLIFHERFKSLKRSVWNVEHVFAGAPDYEFVVYVDRTDTRDIKNNNFIINTARTEDIFGPDIFTEGLNLGSNCTGRSGPPDCLIHPEGGFVVPSIASARLNTKNKFSFKYGTVEIRAKLPSGDWLYPILNLNPSGEAYGKYYESGQIKIAFIEGNENYNQILKGGVILGDGTLARNYYMMNLTSDVSWAETFHKYQLEWTPDSIKVGVDDEFYATIEPPEGGFVSLISDLKILKSEDWKKGTKLAPFDKEMYIQLGVGVGGLNFPDREDGSKPWKNKERLMVKKFYEAEDEWLSSWDEGTSSLKIDYIKIWAL